VKPTASLLLVGDTSLAVLSLDRRPIMPVEHEPVSAKPAPKSMPRMKCDIVWLGLPDGSGARQWRVRVVNPVQLLRCYGRC
jgi:hypothetical protein